MSSNGLPPRSSPAADAAPPAAQAFLGRTNAGAPFPSFLPPSAPRSTDDAFNRQHPAPPPALPSADDESKPPRPPRSQFLPPAVYTVQPPPPASAISPTNGSYPADARHVLPTGHLPGAPPLLLPPRSGLSRSGSSDLSLSSLASGESDLSSFQDEETESLFAISGDEGDFILSPEERVNAPVVSPPPPLADSNTSVDTTVRDLEASVSSSLDSTPASSIYLSTGSRSDASGDGASQPQLDRSQAALLNKALPPSAVAASLAETTIPTPEVDGGPASKSGNPARFSLRLQTDNLDPPPNTGAGENQRSSPTSTVTSPRSAAPPSYPAGSSSTFTDLKRDLKTDIKTNLKAGYVPSPTTFSPTFDFPGPSSTSSSRPPPPLTLDQAFTLAQAAPAPPTLAGALGKPLVLRKILEYLRIVDILNLWQASLHPERAALETRTSREEIRVWGLGWAGYTRGALTQRNVREGWERIASGTILDFLSTLSLPPNSILPPHLVRATTNVTLLLRTSHEAQPPPGPHLIPFEEEDCLPPPLPGLRPDAPPSARTRALPNGRELVFPTPLAPAGSPAHGPKSAIENNSHIHRLPTINDNHQSKLLRRKSASQSSLAIHWGSGSKSPSSGGGSSAAPPSSFNNSSALLTSSAASIHSVHPDGETGASSRPPTAQHPVPRRYEFVSGTPKPVPSIASQHRRSLDLESQSVYSAMSRNPMAGRGGGLMVPSPHQRVPSDRSRAGFPGDSEGPPMPPFLTSGYRLGGPSSSSRESSSQNLSLSSGISPSPSMASVPWTSGRYGSSSPESLDDARRRGLNGGARSHRYSGPVEPLFLSSTSPYRYNRAPIIRIIVPLPKGMPWPSPSALKLCHRELDALGLLAKMRLGDLVENLSVSHPRRLQAPGVGWTTGAMIFIPPYLHPLSFTHSVPTPLTTTTTATSPNGGPLSPVSVSSSPSSALSSIKGGHLPPSYNSFLHTPTYYHAVLPLPYVVYLDLTPFASQIVNSLRLAHQRTELPSARGEILSVEVWVHEAGFQIGGGGVHAGGPRGPAAGSGLWDGTTVVLEADGTKEGKDELLARVSGPTAGRRQPWEILGSKSTRGSVWLKLIRENIPVHEH